MILTLIIAWVLVTVAFFGGLAFLASRPMPPMDFTKSAPEHAMDKAPQWEDRHVKVPAELHPAHSA